MSTTATHPDNPATSRNQSAGHAAAWRIPAYWVLVILFAVTAPLALVEGWARLTVLDTDTYVERVAPLASNPDVQETVIHRTVLRLVDNPRVATLLASGTISGQDIEDATRFVVQSDAFEEIWTSANRILHPKIAAVLRGDEIGGVQTTGGYITVNMDMVAEAVENRLGVSGLQIGLGSPVGDVPLSVTVFRSRDLEKVQGLIRLFDRLAIALPIVATGALIGAIVVHTHRRTAIRRAGVSLAIGMGVTLVLLFTGRWFYLDMVAKDAPVHAARALFDILTRSLWQAALALLLIGILAMVLSGSGKHKSEVPALAPAASTKGD